LGYGRDTFTVESTHAGTTTIDAGPGNDTVTIRTINGHTRVIGGPATQAALHGTTDNDTFLVGSATGVLDLLAALLVLDGGTGYDVATLTESSDANANLGWLTQDTLTGLGMVPRTVVDDRGRPLDRL